MRHAKPQLGPSSKTYITKEQLARRWGLAPKTLENWRAMGRRPTFEKHGRTIAYLLDDVLAMEREGLRRPLD